VATSKAGQKASATINIADVRKTILALGIYAMSLGALVVIGILLAWGNLYHPPATTQVIVNPAVVTLDAVQPASVPFTATVVGGADERFSWSVEGGGEIDSGGMFRQKASSQENTLTVTARTTTAPYLFGTAVILIRKGTALQIAPQTAYVFPSQQVPFQTPNVTSTWSVSRSDLGSITSDGLFTAALPANPPQVVQISAWKNGAQAAIATVIGTKPQFAGSSNAGVLIFVILCGMLGSMIYFFSSFVSYVGNQNFRSNWTWFYISRPCVGGGVALIFFFIVGSGLINGTSVGELMKLGMISALVGLFSDKAIVKLSDVMDVLLSSNNTRKDKLDDTTQPAPKAPTTATALQPKITSFDPPNIKPGVATSVTVKGANFGTGYKVKVNQDDATPLEPTDGSFRVAITANQAVAPAVLVTVSSNRGSDTAKIDVEE
jgi:hypothetical protein